MADDAELQIKITTEADTSGAEQAQEAIKGVEESTIAAGEAGATGGVKITSAFSETAGVAGTLGQAFAAGSKEAGEHVEGLHFKGTDLRKLILTLTKESPLLGLALKAAISGPGALILGLIAGFKAVKHEWEDTKEALKPPEKWEDFTQTIQNQAAAIESESIAVNKFAREMTSAVNATEKLTKATEAAIEAARRNARVADELANAKKAAEKAEIDLAEKQGKISPEQAHIARLQLDQAYEQLASSRKQTEMIDVISEKEALLGKLRDKEGDRARALHDAELAQTKAKTTKQIDDDVELWKKRAENAKKAVEEIQKHIAEAQDVGVLKMGMDVLTAGATSRIRAQRLGALREELPFAEEAAEVSAAAAARQAKTATERKIQYDDLADAVEQARKDFKEAHEKMKALPDEIDKLKKELRSFAETREQRDPLVERRMKAEVGIVLAGQAQRQLSETVAGRREAEEALEGGAGTTSDQRRMLARAGISPESPKEAADLMAILRRELQTGHQLTNAALREIAKHTLGITEVTKQNTAEIERVANLFKAQRVQFENWDREHKRGQ